jgi:molybdopterin-containing oxidoreductase family iron-sulfur binding subunit
MKKEHQKEPLDLAAIRERLAEAQGQQYWRSLEELAQTEDFQEFLHREFPRKASVMGSVSRREFLKLMGASLALAGLNACTNQPREKIVPYVRPPEEVIPGKPLFFATAMPLGGFARGVLVESHMGRPTKIEGNPEHPASLGATDVFAQASVLTLYDPDRSQVVINAGRISTWDNFLTSVTAGLEEQGLKKGSGMRVLTETVTSPTLAHQLQQLLTEFPSAKWHQYEPAGRDNVRAGARLAFGEPVDTHYRFDQADVILALDADFLCANPGSLRYARDFAGKRSVQEEHAEMNRLYVVESTPSNTGSMADHRLSLRASEIEGFARALAQELGVEIKGTTGEGHANPHHDWIAALARDLQGHRSSSIVLAGDQQPPVVHALVHAINHALGNVGETVIYTEPVEANPVDQMESLRDLVKDIEAGLVEILVILSGNPVFTTPADLHFADRLDKVKLRIHLGLYDDETSELCHWHLPETHYLESWSDARAYDGTVTIIQPLIAPLYGGKSAHELLAALMGKSGRSGHDIVRDYWKSRYPTEDFEKLWQISLHDGLIADTALPPKDVELKIESLDSQSATPQGLELIFQPDPTIGDGRFANNGWLQELPKPLTKLTWDNAALISFTTAEHLGLTNGDVVELRYQGRMVNAPIWIMPGHADDAVTVHLGYGRKRTGRVGQGAGFNAYTLCTSDAPWFGSGLEIEKNGKHYSLASTQDHQSMEGRHLVRVGTIEHYQEHPDFVRHMVHEIEPASLLPAYEYEGYKWGMAIDLNACIGCNACVVACQSENNIPVVGKKEVENGREMHWIRLDHYYEGNPANPEGSYHQPVPCMHCENAPCELVCPVEATVHSDEGLNEMVYNRCVGTRYCSNNCPYKVRRFNFLQYADKNTESLKLLNNPDVTVRDRGVMEKCTYCVQRINTARIEAKKEDRQIGDGEVVTACQAVCPTQAIVFGDLNNPESQVTKRKAEPLNYGLLTELNTNPRTTYLARLRNPNPELEDEEHGNAGTH